MQAEVNIGLLGHVDHGKTTLTYALTGKWTDTHSEEIKRGISIRLGYADAYIYHCPKCNRITLDKKCPGCGGPTEIKRKISFVDAPGHETLMTTVISAASILNGALFLIAANEPCPQPQTLEHMLVLNTTGIRNIIVVQTKVDLVTKEKALENYKQIKEFLKGTAAENAPIVPVSANNRLNLDRLAERIIENIPPPKYEKNAPLRMYVSRSFDINRPGSEIEKLHGGVVGGSIVLGTVKVGDEIEISPGISKKEGAPPEPVFSKVMSLREESDDMQEAGPGGLIAVGTTLDPSITKSDGLVGSIIGRKGEVPKAVNEINIKYTMLKRPDMEVPLLRENEPVVLSVHTYAGVGAITKLAKGKATVRLKRPTIVYNNMNVALSRRVGQRWRLCAWGTVA
ncbi:translation initiation factor IF-2 subunit gamma [Candidatus Micrarchaeota archaeon]|nr:translation initiation factor IF-2 subunit gamma [Candidatus Micrarchaeota archaeon]